MTSDSWDRVEFSDDHLDLTGLIWAYTWKSSIRYLANASSAHGQLSNLIYNSLSDGWLDMKLCEEGRAFVEYYPRPEGQEKGDSQQTFPLCVCFLLKGCRSAQDGAAKVLAAVGWERSHLAACADFQAMPGDVARGDLREHRHFGSPQSVFTYGPAHVCPFVFVFGLARNMKSGIDNSFLETHVEMLEQLFRLDPRGGFFKHDEIKRVLTHLCNEEAAAKKLAELSKKSKCSTLNTIERLAYSIRVMLAHVREKYNGQLQVAAENKRPGPFDDIYAVLSAHEGSAPAATPAAQTRS
jgi:hypothetical protein